MSWDRQGKQWYDRCVGDEGHYYHRSLVLPGALRLLNVEKKKTLLDVGCGQGVLQRALPSHVQYVGIDASSSLLKEAKKRSSSQARFIHADATKPFPLAEETFDAISFILSLQNIPEPLQAITHATVHLKAGGAMVFILNHPCFRIPRQSHWGVDPQTQIQYRRLNGYVSPLSIPIQVAPSQQRQSEVLYSYHFPLSSFMGWLEQNGLAVVKMEEWCSDKKSEGMHRKREDRARKEFPLFLAIVAKRISS